jgi:hypothetical protein
MPGVFAHIPNPDMRLYARRDCMSGDVKHRVSTLTDASLRGGTTKQSLRDSYTLLFD